MAVSVMTSPIRITDCAAELPRSRPTTPSYQTSAPRMRSREPQIAKLRHMREAFVTLEFGLLPGANRFYARPLPINISTLRTSPPFDSKCESRAPPRPFRWRHRALGNPELTRRRRVLLAQKAGTTGQPSGRKPKYRRPAPQRRADPARNSRSSQPPPCILMNRFRSHDPDEQGEARQAGQGGEKEERGPAELIGEIAARGGQQARAKRGQRSQQRVLRRGEGDAAQPREISDKRRRAHSVGQVFGADGQRQNADVMAGPNLHHVHQVRQHLQHTRDEERAQYPEAGDQDSASGDAGEGGAHPIDLGDG